MTKAPCHPCTSHVTRSMLTYLPSTDTGLHRYVGNGHQSIHGVCTDQLNCLHVLAAVVRAACLRRRAPRWPDLMHPGFALSGQTGAKSQKAPNTQGLLPLRHARPCKSDSLLDPVSSVSKGMETCPPDARYAILLSLARILLHTSRTNREVLHTATKQAHRMDVYLVVCTTYHRGGKVSNSFDR